jgi:hypothetical protein
VVRPVAQETEQLQDTRSKCLSALIGLVYVAARLFRASPVLESAVTALFPWGCVSIALKPPFTVTALAAVRRHPFSVFVSRAHTAPSAVRDAHLKDEAPAAAVDLIPE